MLYQTEKPKSELNEIQDNGICSTCNNVDGCVRLRESEQPVNYCNEYDDYTVTGGSIDYKCVENNLSIDSEVSGSKLYKGICVNCEKRFKCMYALANGGVWHCNEYV